MAGSILWLLQVILVLLWLIWIAQVLLQQSLLLPTVSATSGNPGIRNTTNLYFVIWIYTIMRLCGNPLKSQRDGKERSTEEECALEVQLKLSPKSLVISPTAGAPHPLRSATPWTLHSATQTCAPPGNRCHLSMTSPAALKYTLWMRSAQW